MKGHVIFWNPGGSSPSLPSHFSHAGRTFLISLQMASHHLVYIEWQGLFDSLRYPYSKLVRALPAFRFQFCLGSIPLSVRFSKEDKPDKKLPRLSRSLIL
jgi:hypothetical protein